MRLWPVFLCIFLMSCFEPDFRRECEADTDCPEGQQCSYSSCILLEDCPEDNQTRCGDQCVVISSDVNHCGSCDPCPELANAKALSCVQGLCQYECDAGYRDVDGDLSMAPLGTGCECPPGQQCDTCPEECGASEVCRDGRCVQVECVDNTPCSLPEPACEGNSIRSWTGTGTCVDNSCDRQLALTPCQGNQLCQDGLCVDTDCSTDTDCLAPEPFCEGDQLITYSANNGTCQQGACDFGQITQRQDCTLLERRCQDGACVDLCQGVLCDDPLPPPTCDDNTVVFASGYSCQWETGQCMAQLERDDCTNPEVCQRGYCTLRHEIVIPSGTTALSESVNNTISHYFLMDATEVTRQSYESLMGEDPSIITTSPLYPVNNVLWLNAISYANRRSRLANLPQCYSSGGLSLFDPISTCTGWRLPTNAEFTWATAAQTDTTWYCGDEPACQETTILCGQDDVAEVSSLLPNPWGLFDTSGNVAEWLHDWDGALPPEHVVDWSGPANGEAKLIGGGAAGYFGSDCRTGFVEPLAPDVTLEFVGFRLVRTLPSY